MQTRDKINKIKTDCFTHYSKWFQVLFVCFFVCCFVLFSLFSDMAAAKVVCFRHLMKNVHANRCQTVTHSCWFSWIQYKWDRIDDKLIHAVRLVEDEEEELWIKYIEFSSFHKLDGIALTAKRIIAPLTEIQKKLKRSISQTNYKERNTIKVHKLHAKWKPANLF